MTFWFKLWRYKTEEPIFSTLCIFDKFVMFGCHDNNLYFLNNQDGTLIWKFNCLASIYGSPAIYHCLNKPYITCITSDGVLFVFDLNGNQLLSQDLFGRKNSCYSSPILSRNEICIVSRDNFIYSISLEWLLNFTVLLKLN